MSKTTKNSENKPTGYLLSRKWFAFCLENPARVTPNHSALYLWFIELNNRMGWAFEFAAPSDYCMAAVGMKSYNTYSKTLKELIEFGFVEVIKPSVNQFTACIITLSNFNGAPYEALDRALIGHRLVHAPEQDISNEQAKEDISKHLNSKQSTNTNTAPAAFSDFNEKKLDELNPKESHQPLSAGLKNLKKTEHQVVLPWTDPEFSATWQRWKEYRKAEKKDNYKSVDGENSALKRLDELANGNEQAAIKIINYSMAQGYKGLFPITDLSPGKKVKAKEDYSKFQKP